MAFTLPSHVVGETAFDAGLRLPQHAVGESAFDAGLRFPGHTVGSSVFDSGLRVPKHTVGEDSPSVTTCDNALPLLQVEAYDHDYALNTLPLLEVAAVGTFLDFSFNTLPLLSPSSFVTADSAINTLPLLQVTIEINQITISLPLLQVAATLTQEDHALNTLPLLQAAGQVHVGATSANELPALQALGELFSTVTGSVEATLPALTGNAEFGFSAVNTLPVITIDATLVSGASIAAENALPMLHSASILSGVQILTSEAALPALQMSAVLAAGAVMTAEAILAPLKNAATLLSGANMSAANTLPAPVSEGTLFGAYLLSVDALLPALQGSSAISAALAVQYRTWVMNMRKGVLTEYENFNFNSFAFFNGMVLAAGPAGIFKLNEADKDVEAPIVWRFKTGKQDYESSFLKRVPRIYVEYRAEGDAEFTTITSEGGEQTYYLAENGIAEVQTRRVPVGRGAKSRRWQMEMKSVDGKDVKVNGIIVYPEVLSRRVGGA